MLTVIKLNQQLQANYKFNKYKKQRQYNMISYSQNGNSCSADINCINGQTKDKHTEDVMMMESFELQQ